MTDAFELLGEERRPWIDGAALQECFSAASREVHPDRHHAAGEAERAEAGGRYAELNAAFRTLREPRLRLLHLLELETASRPRDIQRIPPGTMDLFVEVGQMCRDVDAFLARRSAVTSPMLKVQLFREGIDWVEKLKSVQSRVRERESALDAALRDLNSRWETAPPPGSPERPGALPLERIEEIYRVLSYAARWTEQLQERLVQLASP